MTKRLLVIAALCAVGSLSVAHAGPTMGALDALKARASEGATVQQAHYYHRGYHHWRHHYRRDCWWKDPMLCRYFW